MPKGLQGFQRGHPNYFHPSPEKLIEIKTRMKYENPMKNPVLKEKHRKIMQLISKNPERNKKISQKLNKKVPRECSYCRKVNYLPPCRIKTRNFCNRICQSLWESEYFKGKNNPFFGKTHKKGRFSGKNHPQWKGGITPFRKKSYFSEEYESWRRAVFERDNYTCQRCNSKGNIVAHHIKSWSKYPELRFEVSNGSTLCRKPCHMIIHNGNFRIDNSENFLK